MGGMGEMSTFPQEAMDVGDETIRIISSAKRNKSKKSFIRS